MSRRIFGALALCEISLTCSPSSFPCPEAEYIRIFSYTVLALYLAYLVILIILCERQKHGHTACSYLPQLRHTRLSSRSQLPARPWPRGRLLRHSYAHYHRVDSCGRLYERVRPGRGRKRVHLYLFSDDLRGTAGSSQSSIVLGPTSARTRVPTCEQEGDWSAHVGTLSSLTPPPQIRHLAGHRLLARVPRHGQCRGRGARLQGVRRLHCGGRTARRHVFAGQGGGGGRRQAATRIWSF